MHREYRRCDPGGIRRNQAFQDLQQQHHRRQVQSQVDGMVSPWVAAPRQSLIQNVRYVRGRISNGRHRSEENRE